jgi:hypothetical protein
MSAFVFTSKDIISEIGNQEPLGDAEYLLKTLLPTGLSD